MKINKRLLLAGVIATVVVLAVPALALASVWKDGATEVTTLIELGLNGGELFETSESDGMSCAVHAKLTTEGKSTGKITEFNITECPKASGFGKFSGCELTSAEAVGLPWTVDVKTSDLAITGVHTKRTFKAGCAITEVNKTITSLTVTLLSPTAIAEMEFAGETTGFKTHGSFAVEGENSGTYGIG